MKQTIKVGDAFGAFCADGESAVRFRRERIEPFLDMTDEIELDFAGIRNANSSFCNGLLSGLVARHSPDVIRKLRIVNCGDSVKVMLIAALQLGVSRWQNESVVV